MIFGVQITLDSFKQGDGSYCMNSKEIKRYIQITRG